MISRSTSNLTADIGVIGFEEALVIQHRLRELREQDLIGDIILFLEHPSVYTVGRHPNPNNFSSVKVISTERGGDVTYHGPGQLVIYPIVKIGTPEKVDVRKYVNMVQEIIIKSMETLGFHCHLGEEPGIWVYDSPVGDRKVASLGMAIVRGIAFHGISINLTADVLPGFSRINPCGMDSNVMGFLGISRDKMIHAVLKNFSAYYNFEMNLNREQFFEFYGTLKN